jgi:hypothetical protein
MTEQMILLEPDLPEIPAVQTPADIQTDLQARRAAPAPRRARPKRRVALHVEHEQDEFRMDSHTRAIGRAGIAAAREALADAVRRSAEREHIAA